MARPPAKTACRLYDCLRIRQCKSDRLMFDDRMKSSAPLRAGKMQHKVNRGSHQSHAEHPHQCRSACETSCAQCEAAALLSDQIGAWREHVIETELRQQVSAMSDRLNRALEDEAGGRALDGDYGNRTLRRRRGIRTAYDTKNVGA